MSSALSALAGSCPTATSQSRGWFSRALDRFASARFVRHRRYADGRGAVDLDPEDPWPCDPQGTFPIAAGLAMVPRPIYGFVISGTSIATLYALRSFPSIEMPGGSARLTT
ncbi:MAG: hypothetical protein U0894_18750 [Pirellulales bacterium]